MVTLSKRFSGGIPHSIEKSYIEALNNPKKIGVMHYVRKNSSGENGYRHFRRNRALTKLVFHILYFQQGQNTKMIKSIIASPSYIQLK